jgi:hypothetical protein
MNLDSHSLIFVGDKPFRIWTGGASFRDEDFIRGFDHNYHLNWAKSLESALDTDNSKVASLAIRTIHGLATEALFALIFSVLQAPENPAAWFLLYRLEDLENLISKVNSGEEFESRVDLGIITWRELGRVLMPFDESDVPGAEAAVARFVEVWERLAQDFLNPQAKEEFRSLKHGFRLQPASPVLLIGGRHIQAAEHGSWFPMPNKYQREVILNVGFRSWSAKSLLAEIEVISASFFNLLSLLKQVHGVEKFLTFEVPDDSVFEASKPPSSQALSSLSFNNHWSDVSKIQLLDKAEALEAYRQLGKLEARKR